MESFPNITFNCNNKQMSNFIDIKRTSTFNYSSNIKIQLKKRSNSMLININKNNWLSIKYNFINTNKKFLESNIFDKLKSSLVKSDKKIPIMKKNNIFKKEDYDMNIKKIVTFDKKKIDCQNNRIIIIKDMSNKELFKRKPKKFNSFDSDELIIPLKSKNEYKKDDFEVLSLCGKGAYGTVLQVKLKSNVEQENKNKKDKEKEKEKFYAIKVIDKESMKKVNKFYQIYLESQILNELNSPFIVQIHGTFESKSKIYMVLDYLSNGNFATFLKMNYPLKEETIRFYAAEIVLFLEYLQSQKIVHRDLKPENIMLNEKYHLQIIDFATVRKIGYYYDKNEMKFRLDNYDLENDNEDIKGTKIIVNPDDDDDDEEEEEEEEEKDINLDNNIKNDNKHRIKRLPPRNKTFVGTAEYVSPEVIKDQTAEYGADLWAFGIILYEMFCGKTPFKGVNTFLTFKNIETLNITYEENISISENAKDLIKKILVKEPSKRLGAGEPKTDLDLEHLKKHPFFKGIKWKNIINQNVPNSKLFKFKTKKMVRRKRNSKSENEIKNSENKNVIVLKKGSLYKKSFWFHYNERYMILDSSPKITYKDLEKNIVKGIIYLNKKCKVYASRQDIFNLDTPKGVYKFKCKHSNEIALWINAIKDCIKTYGKE